VTRLVLFDIDGTLLSAGAVSRRALRIALEESFGTVGGMESYDYSGKTDPQIVVELMAAEGIPDARVRERLKACLAVYQEALGRELRPEHVAAKPGVPALLEELQKEPSVTLGLLTGNLERCARIKLDPLSLNPFFPFGAFGSDDADRYALPRVAVERALRATGTAFSGKSVVIVGDSIHDVRCGQDLGVRAVAVASGRTSKEVLARESPDALLADFEGTAEALDAILGGRG
jgi:phosphoglycolate phosphatase-like HAD superfamily hydrolase